MTLWPVRQNPVLGKGWGRGDRVRSGDLETLIAGPCPWFPPPYKEEMGRSVSIERPISWIRFDLMGFIFHLISTFVIKQIRRDCCRRVRKFVSVPASTLGPCLPPHTLCWGTLLGTHVDVQHSLSSVPQELQSVRSLCSPQGWPRLLPWTGQEHVSIALEEVTCLLWFCPAPPFLTPGWPAWGGLGSRVSGPPCLGTGI